MKKAVQRRKNPNNHQTHKKNFNFISGQGYLSKIKKQ